MKYKVKRERPDKLLDFSRHFADCGKAVSLCLHGLLAYSVRLFSLSLPSGTSLAKRCAGRRSQNASFSRKHDKAPMPLQHGMHIPNFFQ